MGKKLTGDLAQTAVGTNISITGSTTSSSVAVTAVSSIVGLVIGQVITGAGIPVGTTIAAFSSGSITLSQDATATATGVALTVLAQVQTLGLMEWTIDWKLKTADATTTDDSAYESSLPGPASWTAKAKFAYLDGDTSQEANVRATISTLERTLTTYNFFTEPVTGVDSFVGQGYIDGITMTASVGGKIVGMDVSIKGSGPLTIVSTIAPLTTTATLTGLQAQN